jgi:hypothetical protein
VKNELIPILGVTPKLQDGYPYEKIVIRCKNLIAIMMRELKARDTSLVKDKFNTVEKRQWLYAILAECCATLGYTGEKLCRMYNRWEEQKSHSQHAYDPDGYLWLLNYMRVHSDDENFQPSDYMDIYGNVEMVGQNVINEAFGVDAAARAARTTRDTSDQNRNVTSILSKRRQGEEDKLNKRARKVQEFMVNHGLTHANSSTGIPNAIVAVRGQMRDEANMLDYNVTELSEEERGARDAGTPILSDGNFAQFWPLLTERMKHFHDPANVDQDHYTPIAADLWYHICGVGQNGQLVPLYYTMSTTNLIPFVRKLGMPVRRKYRKLIDIAYGLARRYSVPGVVFPPDYVHDANVNVLE